MTRLTYPQFAHKHTVGMTKIQRSKAWEEYKKANPIINKRIGPTLIEDVGVKPAKFTITSKHVEPQLMQLIEGLPIVPASLLQKTKKSKKTIHRAGKRR